MFSFSRFILEQEFASIPMTSLFESFKDQFVIIDEMLYLLYLLNLLYILNFALISRSLYFALRYIFNVVLKIN